jgi:hypothetical protein
MADEHTHEWVAATLYHLTPDEASIVAAYPDYIEDAASTSPKETVGPLCLECGSSWRRGVAPCLGSRSPREHPDVKNQALTRPV